MPSPSTESCQTTSTPILLMDLTVCGGIVNSSTIPFRIYWMRVKTLPRHSRLPARLTSSSMMATEDSFTEDNTTLHGLETSLTFRALTFEQPSRH